MADTLGIRGWVALDLANRLNDPALDLDWFVLGDEIGESTATALMTNPPGTPDDGIAIYRPVRVQYVTAQGEEALVDIAEATRDQLRSAADYAAARYLRLAHSAVGEIALAWHLLDLARQADQPAEESAEA